RSAIPQIQVGFRWHLNPAMGIVTDPANNTQWDLSSLMVASDMTASQHHGVSAHADFMSGWSDDVLQDLMKTCYWSPSHNPAGTGPRHCGAIGGDDPCAGVDGYDWPPGDRHPASRPAGAGREGGHRGHPHHRPGCRWRTARDSRRA